MRSAFRFAAMCSTILVASCASVMEQHGSTDQPIYEVGRSYDARTFLSKTQVNALDTLYPRPLPKEIKEGWEWMDVDPLALFTPTENRRRRRELFLYEYSPDALLKTESGPTPNQIAFKSVLQARFPEAVVLMTSGTVKLVSRYESSYETLPTLHNPNLSIPPQKNILELIADLGLQWSILEGNGTKLSP